MSQLEDNLKWFENIVASPSFERFASRPIAYFSAEFALDDNIPTFAGGLGVLAGDVIKEASDRGVNMIGVSLFYREGYNYSEDEENTSGKVLISPEQAGLIPVVDEQNEPIVVTIPIGDHHILVKAWQWMYKANVVYFLDTDIEENSPEDRLITHKLYTRVKEIRLKQEILLGIGGLRILEALKIHPQIYHLNEGHSALLSLELIRHEMVERKLTFDEAKQFAKRRIVFSNHTLVAAGHELYSREIVEIMLAKFAEELGVPVGKIVELGLVSQSTIFSLTNLCLEMAGIVNAVSKLHSQKAKQLWPEYPMVGITNGVYIPRWDKINTSVSEKGAFWKIHQQNKKILLEMIKQKCNLSWGEDELLLGWARRIVKYKRPLAILENIERLASLARRENLPIRIVFSGKHHPDSKEDHQTLNELKKMIAEKLPDVAVFLSDYNLTLAQDLVAGCDVWLNTPIVGFEACGTSGMKASLNGSLPVSTKDGWVDEAELFKVGWILDDSNVSEDLLEKLEKQIIPMYYQKNTNGVPEDWEEHMRNSREMILNQFSSTRMLKEYIEMLYI